MGFVIRRRDGLSLAALATLALLAWLRLDSSRVLVGEICAFLAMALLLSRHAGVRSTLRSLDPPYRLAVVLLPVLLVAGHVANRADRAYPFITWELYTTPLPARPAYHEYTATLANGQQITLPLRSLFPGLAGLVGVTLESATWHSLHRGSAAERERASARMQALLLALAREYERRHPDSPVRSLDVWHRAIPTERYQGRASITRDHERRLDVP